MLAHYTIIRIDVEKQRLQSVSNKPVLLITTMVEVLYTGLNRTIGAPQDYLKNRDESNFPSHYDLRIPVEETNEAGRSSDIGSLGDCLSNLNLNEGFEEQKVGRGEW